MMKLAVLVAALAALATAAPAGTTTSHGPDAGSQLQRRDRVFTDTTYDALSISDAKAGNGATDALEKLRGLPTDLATVEKADIEFLEAVNQIANQAEREGINKAIVDAGVGDVALQLQCGKVLNKILKLQASVLHLTILEAQGKGDSAKLELESKKLKKNKDADTANAGKQCKGVKFDASTASPVKVDKKATDEIAKQAAAIVSESKKAASKGKSTDGKENGKDEKENGKDEKENGKDEKENGKDEKENGKDDD